MSDSSLLARFRKKAQLGFHSSVAAAPDLCLPSEQLVAVDPPQLVIAEPSEFDVEPVKAKLSCSYRFQETRQSGVRKTLRVRAQLKAGHMCWHKVACTCSARRRQL